MIEIKDGAQGTVDVKLSAPWVSYYKKIKTLFDEDPNVSVDYDEDNREIKIYVDGTDKATALDTLLPDEKSFGNVVVKTTVIPANKVEKKIDLLRTAFDGNPNFSYATTVEGVLTNPISYVVFKPKVAQYWDDNLHDPHGLVSTLYANIAGDVIGESDGICFATDSVDADLDDYTY